MDNHMDKMSMRKLITNKKHKKMETTMKSISVDNINLMDKINESVSKMNEIIKNNNYRYYLDGKQTDTIQVPSDIKITLNVESRTFRKKVLSRIVRFEKKSTRRQMNLLLHILDMGKVKVSEKEEQIRNARKEWIKLRGEAEKARLNYREIKGDFYKS
jgi:hypothetical protein